VALSIVASNGRGREDEARVRCSGSQVRATGYFVGRAATACVEVRRLAGFLRREPRRRRICTQVFGGPQSARISGVVGGKRINRRFHRADGCGVADWSRIEPLLPRHLRHLSARPEGADL
jgi:hypothetical protein